MHLGQKVSICRLSADGEKVIFCEKTQSRNCVGRYLHEMKIINKTIVSLWFSPSAYISLFVSEQSLHHGSFLKVPSQLSIARFFMWMDRGHFTSPRKIWWEENSL
jgi:hypothetical protein